MLTILESPFKGNDWSQTSLNETYGLACLRDSLMRGESPMASHLIYAREGVLDDRNLEERALGIEAGLAWGKVAEKTVVYTDFGISGGMEIGIYRARAEGRPVEFRELGGVWAEQRRAG